VKKFIFTLLVFSYISSYAQLSEGGIPFGIGNNLSKNIFYNIFETQGINEAILDDERNDLNKNIPYRFGLKMPVNINLQKENKWLTLANGDRLWQYAIECPSALSLNFIFEKVFIPNGSKLFIYNPTTKQCLGAFTNQNNNKDSLLATTLILTNKVIIEYYEPKNNIGLGKFVLSEIVHGYRNFLKDAKTGFGQSGGCQVNVNCSLGYTWHNEKRAVVLIMVNGNAICTGTLINDVPQDTLPYILTANHCGNASNNTVFVFNYESSFCSNVNGSLSQSIQGGTTVASNPISDFNLVLLSSKVPSNFNPFYAGWSRSRVAPDSVVGIHHPNGDIKKISFANNTCSDSSYLGKKCWKISTWSIGCTEPASSGSPLFNKNHQLVGQLLGGPSYCGAINSDMNDYYGMFPITWDSGAVITDRAKEWLDPNATDTIAINGFDPFAVTPSTNIDAGIIHFEKPAFGKLFCSDSLYAQIIIKNFGAVPINSLEIKYAIDNNTPQSINYSTGSIPSGFLGLVDLPALYIPNYGLHQLTVNVNKVNGTSDGNVSNNMDTVIFFHKNTVSITLNIQTDNWGSETSWEIKNSQGQVFYNGGPYNDLVGGQSLIYNNICLEPGCYNFIIYDNNGDGICCGGNGNGSYTLLNAASSPLFTGGQFLSVSTHSFCLDADNVSGVNPLNCLTIFPNPTSDFVRMNIENVLPNQELKIYNAQGQIIYHKVVVDKNLVIDVRTFNAGVYFVKYENKILGRFTKIRSSE
jgi:lysyl endopeptidase